MITLYKHQDKFVNDIRTALRTHNGVVGQAPTGFGKTIVGAFMAASAISKKKKIFFTVHRRELLTQTAQSFDKFSIKYGYIAAGLPQNPFHSCQVISIDTAKNRLDSMPVPDLVVVDEAHLAMAAGWLKVIQHWKEQGAKFVFLTATPRRLDGKGLDGIATAIVKGPSVDWLIENKFLSTYRYFAPSQPDLAGIANRMGDYSKKELGETMDKKTLTGNVITHYKEKAPNTKAVAFCVSVAHAQHVAEELTAAGIPAACLSGVDRSERPALINRFASGELKVLTNVEIITTGFDLAAQVNRDVTIDCIILLRPTQSLSLFLQMVGRGLRAKDYPCIILDHAGCALTHGLPDDPREWTLEGDPKQGKKSSGEKSEPVKQCNKCYFVHKPAPSCPDCGHVYEVKERKLETVEGELEELNPEEIRQQFAQERAAAHSAEDLEKFAEAKGYKKGYADHVQKAREEKQALQRELFNLTVGAQQVGLPLDYNRSDVYKFKPKELRLKIQQVKQQMGAAYG